MASSIVSFFKKRTQSVETLSEDPSSHSDSTEEVLDIKGDQFSGNNEQTTLLNLTSLDMIALGLTTAIGGHYFAWNAGLAIGLGGFVIVLFLISTAFYALVLCMAELSSALPFAGGAYGIARVTLGIYPGFLVAVCDSYKSIIYAATAAFSVGQLVTIASEGNHRSEFGYWFAFYIGCLAVHLYGGKFFWRVNFTLAALSVILLLIYIFGAIRFADLEQNAAYPGSEGLWKWFHGGGYEFVGALPLATRFFQGIQSINLACGQIKNPKTEVPKGYIGSMTFVMFTSFAVLFLATAVKPGLAVFIVRLRPLSSGFKQMLALPPLRATILSIPATIMSGFGFMYYYGQQLSAMGKSGMLNPVFGKEIPGRNTPYVSLIVGSVLGYMLCVIEWYYPDTQDQIYALSILGATATYLSIFVSFWMFRNYFPTIKREFVSPLGTPGAIYGFLVFFLVFMSICGFQKDQMAVIVFSIIMFLSSVYYYFVVQKRQLFSEEEKTVMFKAYLVKNNAAKASRIRRGPSLGVGGGANRAGGKPERQPDKKSVMMTNKVEVAPVSITTSGASCEPRNSSSGGHTPTSLTVTLPYRAAETTEPAQDQARDHSRESNRDTSPTGPRQRSGTDILHASGSNGGASDIETGAGARDQRDSDRQERREERSERSVRRGNSNTSLSAAQARSTALEETDSSAPDGAEV